MHIIKFAFVVIFSISYLSAQELDMTWALSIGGELEDEAFSVHYDKEDNIYITGEFNGEVDFDPGPSSHYLKDLGYGDAFLLKLDKNGNFEWVVSVGSTADEQGNSVAFDEDNNVYWTGVFQKTVDFDPGPSKVMRTSKGGWDAFILKLNANGEFVWVHTFGGPTSDFSNRISIDSENNLIVCGNFSVEADFDPGPNEVKLFGNIVILKFSSDKSFIWGKAIETTGHMYTRDQVVDYEDNIYVVGEFSKRADFDPGPGEYKISSNSHSYDAFVLKLNKNGAFDWVNTFGGFESDRAEGVDVDQHNNVYISGHFRETVVFNSEDSIILKSRKGNDGYTAKMDSEGEVQWAASIRGTSNNYSYDVCHNKDAQIFVVGNFGGNVDFDPSEEEFKLSSEGNQDMYLLVLNDDSKFLNAVGFGDSQFNISRSVQAKPNGEVVFVGEYKHTVDFDPGMDTLEFRSNGDDDIIVVKFNGQTISASNFEEVKSIDVFPNPAADFVYVPAYIESEKIIKVEVYSMEGTREAIFYNESSSGHFRIQMNGLSGVVVLKIFTKNSVFSSKVISLGG